MRFHFIISIAAMVANLGLAQMRFATTELPAAAMGVHYRTSIDAFSDANCTRGDITYSLAGGELPRGVVLTAFGLDGVPREMGRFRFTIRAGTICAAALRPFELVVTGRPILDVASNEIAFAVGTAKDSMSSTVLVSSTWPSLPYSVETHNMPWLQVNQERGVTPDPESAMTGDVVTLTVDPAKLEPGTYHGSIVFWTRNGANAPTIPVVLVVGKQK